MPWPKKIASEMKLGGHGPQPVIAGAAAWRQAKLNFACKGAGKAKCFAARQALVKEIPAVLLDYAST